MYLGRQHLRWRYTVSIPARIAHATTLKFSLTRVVSDSESGNRISLDRIVAPSQRDGDMETDLMHIGSQFYTNHSG